MSAKSLLIIFGLLLAISDLTYGQRVRCQPTPCGPRTGKRLIMVSAKCTLLRLGGGARAFSRARALYIELIS